MLALLRANPLVSGLSGLVLILVLLLAAQSARLGAANNRADRIQINLNEARAELKRISTAKDEQKAETGQNISKAEKGQKGAETIARKIEAAPIVPGECKTPKVIMEADL